jgi:hypothetical protein
VTEGRDLHVEDDRYSEYAELADNTLGESRAEMGRGRRPRGTSKSSAPCKRRFTTFLTGPSSVVASKEWITTRDPYIWRVPRGLSCVLIANSNLTEMRLTGLSPAPATIDRCWSNCCGLLASSCDLCCSVSISIRHRVIGLAGDTATPFRILCLLRIGTLVSPHAWISLKATIPRHASRSRGTVRQCADHNAVGSAPFAIKL